MPSLRKEVPDPQLPLPGMLSEPVEFVGRDATFQNSKDEPLHNWFPYLEGFGPGFVNSVLKKYLPGAKLVLDPFGGTGTTALTLSLAGISTAYCEANPLMQEVSRIKLTIAALSKEEREELATKIEKAARNLQSRVANSKPAGDLLSTYSECFGDSVFFSAQNLDDILKIRSVIDVVQKNDRVLADALLMSVISKILLCSELKRAGDVRYKTPREKANASHQIIAEVTKQLMVMAADCRVPFVSTGRTWLLTPDARSGKLIEPCDADGVITSPPYLNGTNYIRNTKLELWFARLIQQPSDMRKLRDSVVTSGICDVTARQERTHLTNKIDRLIKELELGAYDRRIPRMVSSYFTDMHKVLIGLQHHTKDNGVICIDIGDSRYAGVNIRTDEILVDLGKKIGLKHIESILLRARQSKDKSALTQKLIIFRNTKSRLPKAIAAGTKRAPSPAPESITESPSTDWETFKKDLPHQHAPFTKRNWGSPLHSLCSYQGKLKPSIAHHIIKATSKPGDRVLDPFSGAGTIPYEAALLGRSAFALDISTTAFSLSKAKLSTANSEKLRARLKDLEYWICNYRLKQDELENAKLIRFNGDLCNFFHPATFREILSARTYLNTTRDDGPEWALIMSSMLHILHGNRPYALSRNSHPITPFAPTGPTIYKSVVEKLSDKVMRSHATQLANQIEKSYCFQGDIASPWPKAVKDINVIVTSPPFFDSTKFYMTNWMRFWFAGWERGSFEDQSAAFIETKQKKTMDVYTNIFANMAKSLVPSGKVVLHLGLSKKCDMASELIKRCADHFSVEDLFTESVLHCQRHGVRDQGSVTGHQYLVLRKI